MKQFSKLPPSSGSLVRPLVMLQASLGLLWLKANKKHLLEMSAKGHPFTCPVAVERAFVRRSLEMRLSEFKDGHPDEIVYFELISLYHLEDRIEASFDHLIHKHEISAIAQ